MKKRLSKMRYRNLKNRTNNYLFNRNTNILQVKVNLLYQLNVYRELQKDHKLLLKLIDKRLNEILINKLKNLLNLLLLKSRINMKSRMNIPILSLLLIKFMNNIYRTD